MKPQRSFLYFVILLWFAVGAYFQFYQLQNQHQAQKLRRLSGVDLAGKHEIILGPELYRFLTFCQKELPPYATYQLSGLEKGSIEDVRFRYYLYPRVQKPNGEFLLYYHSSVDNPNKEDTLYASLDSDINIFQRKR